MVFANLPQHEKNAFFSLLDEYFQSRPELSAKLTSSAPEEVSHTVGRVAAAASAFASSNAAPPPPRRGQSASSPPPAMAKGLVSSQGIGNVDTTSKTRMMVTTFKKAPAAAPAAVAPPAFAARKNNFAPPPSRGVHQHEPEPEPEPEPEEEEAAGEWAEALYDYDSTEPGDLQIRENQRLLVLERTTNDWWTGEFNGKKGLFPASYVKLL